MKKRMNKDEYLKLIASWIRKASENPEMLYMVKLTDKFSEQPVINIEKFGERLGLTAAQSRLGMLKHCQTELGQIFEMMESEGLLTPGISANNLNHINGMKHLLMRLEADASLLKRVPIYRNSVQGGRLIHEFPEYQFSSSLYNVRKNAKSQDAAANYFRDSFSLRVMELLKEEGIYDYSRYIPVNQRETESNEPAKSERDRFKEVRKNLSVSSVSDLGSLSEDAFDFAYRLFALGSRRVSSDSGIANYLCAYQYFEKFLKSKGMSGKKPSGEILTDYVPIKFRIFLEDLIAVKEISPVYATTVLSSFQLSLKRFSDLHGAEQYDFVYVSGFDTRGRTSDTYMPYPKRHREAIADVLEREMQRVWDLHNTPYKQAKSGQSFLKPVQGGERVDGSLCSEENLRWFFDHRLGGQRVTFNDIADCQKDSDEFLFYKALSKYRARDSQAYSTLDELYDSWGVPRNPYREEIFPFYMRLLQLTGMNPNPVLDLEVDAFESSHPATGKACVRYWKGRSKGAKELHLDIFDAEITWLSKSQARKVSEIFEKVKALTENLRAKLPEGHECKNLLFIASGKPPRGYGQIKRLFEQSYDKPRELLQERYLVDLTDKETGEVISLVGTRFRASLVSELVEAGVSIREIQLMLGHVSISTTLQYLDRMDFNRQARHKIQEKLQQIYSNSWVPKEREKLPEQEKYQAEIIFKTPLGGCANIFDPPDFIKKSPGYKGGACSNFNKCLSCENVIITVSHLPDLFALLRDYHIVWNNGKVASTPYGAVVLENIEILESLLGDESEFEKSELRKAERLSRYIDSTVMIDGVAA